MQVLEQAQREHGATHQVNQVSLQPLIEFLLPKWDWTRWVHGLLPRSEEENRLLVETGDADTNLIAQRRKMKGSRLPSQLALDLSLERVGDHDYGRGQFNLFYVSDSKN